MESAWKSVVSVYKAAAKPSLLSYDVPGRNTTETVPETHSELTQVIAGNDMPPAPPGWQKKNTDVLRGQLDWKPFVRDG